MIDNDHQRVLIGSCGGLTGTYLARRLSKEGGFNVEGMDLTDMVPARAFVSQIHCVPRADRPGFLERLCEIVGASGIGYYLPTHSIEIREVARREGDLRRMCPTLKFMVSPYETFLALDDKKTMTRSLESAGIATPEIVGKKPLDVTSYPIFMKHRVGSGGTGAMVVPNADLHVALASTFQDAEFFEYVAGDELTVDCMFDNFGNLLGISPRTRNKTLGGAVITSTTCEAPFAYEIACRLASNWEFRGCVNFQCILRDGIPFVTDINLRYPSGGLPLTVESGLDIPALTMRVLAGDSIGLDACGTDGKIRTMLRYYEELFVEDEA